MNTATTGTETAAQPAVHCRRCGRALKSAKARDLGLGRVCARKARAQLATLAPQFKAAQLEEAQEILELGAYVRTGPADFDVVGSRGDIYHVNTDGQTCNCLGGQHGRACKHLAFALSLAA